MQNRKPIFDAFRRILARGFTAREVRMIDEAIDRALKETGEQLAKESGQSHVMQVSPAGVDLIRAFEGCARLRDDGRYEAYPDPGSGGDPWTIGWGATGPDIKPGLIWTQEQCDERLDKDIERHARDVRKALGDKPTTQGQFDALVSFHFNTGAINRATLTRLHRGGDYAKAADEFLKWKFASGRILNGLVRRRKEERRLYLS